MQSLSRKNIYIYLYQIVLCIILYTRIYIKYILIKQTVITNSEIYCYKIHTEKKYQTILFNQNKGSVKKNKGRQKERNNKGSTGKFFKRMKIDLNR